MSMSKGSEVLKDLFISDEIELVKELERVVFEHTKGEEEWLYKAILFEKLGQLKENPHLFNDIVKDVKDGIHTWDSCIFDSYKRDEEFNFEEMLEGIKVEKGEFKCRNKKCGNEKCYFFTSQTRSRDEGATVYVVCTECHSRYKFN